MVSQSGQVRRIQGATQMRCCHFFPYSITTFLTIPKESIGEWSNPSCEERARQERRRRQMAHRAQGTIQDVPRKLPNFPRPPLTPYIPLSNQREADVLSDPSDEGKILEKSVYPNHRHRLDWIRTTAASSPSLTYSIHSVLILRPCSGPFENCTRASHSISIPSH